MKHIELFKNGFDSTITEKIKPENWPYVGYDAVSGEIVFTMVPEPVEGPANNEIWYTSIDGNEIPLYEVPELGSLGGGLQESTYENGIGVFKFSNDITILGTYSLSSNLFMSITIPNSVTRIEMWVFDNCENLTSIAYNGTTEQWNSITKSYGWNSVIPATYVQCTDGRVEL